MAACENVQETLEEFSPYCDHTHCHSVPGSSDPPCLSIKLLSDSKTSPRVGFFDHLFSPKRPERGDNTSRDTL